MQNSSNESGGNTEFNATVTAIRQVLTNANTRGELQALLKMVMNFPAPIFKGDLAWSDLEADINAKLTVLLESSANINLIEGVVAKLGANNDCPHPKGQPRSNWWMGHNTAFQKVGFLEQALTHAAWELAGVKALIQDVLPHCSGDSVSSIQKLSLSSLVLLTAKVHELLFEKNKDSNIFLSIVESLDVDAYKTLGQLFQRVDIDGIKVIRDKNSAHFDPKSCWVKLDDAVKVAFRDPKDLPSILDLYLDGAQYMTKISPKISLERLLEKIGHIPGYQSPLTESAGR